jgi:hypothetical protein
MTAEARAKSTHGWSEQPEPLTGQDSEGDGATVIDRA